MQCAVKPGITPGNWHAPNPNAAAADHPKTDHHGQSRRRPKHSKGPICVMENPAHLGEHQQTILGWIAKTDRRLHRAYLLKEGLRALFQMNLTEATEALEGLISWARRCQIPAFVELQRDSIQGPLAGYPNYGPARWLCHRRESPYRSGSSPVVQVRQRCGTLPQRCERRSHRQSGNPGY